MLEIKSNGRAKNAPAWDTKSVGIIEDLIEAISKYTLNPMFEDFGNFINYNPKWLKPELSEKYKGCITFSGNFLTYSHVFNIITDDENTITILAEAIENNKKSEDYQNVRNEYIGRKEYKKEMERKWINKEISYQEYNNAII